MKKRILSLLFSIPCLFLGQMIHTTAIAQNNKGKLFSFEDVTPGGTNFVKNFYPEYIERLQWIGDRCVYTNQADLIEKTEKGDEKVLLTTADLKKMFPDDFYLWQWGSFPSFGAVEGHPNYMLISSPRASYVIDLEKKALVRLFSLSKENEARNLELVDIDPTLSRAVVRSAGGALMITEAVTDLKAKAKFILVAQNKGNEIVYGTSVHQHEFGIMTGTFWSPDGKKLAFYRMDQSMVAEYPIVNINPKKGTVDPIRYPMAGGPSHQVTVGVYNTETGKTLYLASGGDPEHFLTNIAWSPKSDKIYMAEVNRKQTVAELNEYKASTGAKLRTLFTETDKKYVEPMTPMRFLPNNSDKFLWESRKDGWNHFYLGSIKDGSLRQITKGEWEVKHFKGFSADGKSFFFTSTNPSPLEMRLYSIRVNGKNMRDITPVAGVHRTSINASTTRILDTYSSMTVPREIDIRTIKGKLICTLLKAENPSKDFALPEITLGTLTSRDGTTKLYYRLTKPVNFDPTKKYPTIIYVYGGPHAQLVTNSWLGGISGWDVYMAQRGYVIFTLDNRGSENRGKAFEQIIHRQVGTIEMEDQMAGVDFLKSQAWVDKERMGVYGWSFGGFMTTNLMLTYPDVFKAAVAGGPVMDWSRYEVMYGERYNDTPQENPEGYKKNNLTLRAANLKGRLLLIHGTSDDVVVWQHAQAFVKACIEARTYPDCMYYPGHKHNVIGRDRVHLFQTIARYFEDHL